MWCAIDQRLLGDQSAYGPQDQRWNKREMLAAKMDKFLAVSVSDVGSKRRRFPIMKSYVPLIHSSSSLMVNMMDTDSGQSSLVAAGSCYESLSCLQGHPAKIDPVLQSPTIIVP